MGVPKKFLNIVIRICCSFFNYFGMSILNVTNNRKLYFVIVKEVILK